MTPTTDSAPPTDAAETASAAPSSTVTASTAPSGKEPDSDASASDGSTDAPAGRPARPPRQGKHARPAKPSPGAAQQQPQQPRQRKVNPVLQRLFELYPKMFGARFLPLKLGVFQELIALHGDEFKRDDLKLALGLHARSTRYLDAVAAGEKRHDLNGVPVEDVAPEHVHHAILEVFKRRQGRSEEDLRPKLRARLVQAIEASGLSREDYMLAVRTQDELSTAVLDEAFAEIGARTAKREALQRAFEASGKTVAEFAEMYGMDPGEVGRTLRRS